MSKLPSGWRIIELMESRQGDYVKRMTDELRSIPHAKQEVPTHFNGKLIANLSPQEREAFYFSQQQPSTQKALEAQKTRKPEQDIDHLLRLMPACLANPEAKNLDELTAKRTLDPSDVMLVEDTRRKAKNALGQSTDSSIKDRRDAGINAFTYSPPADISDADLKRIKKLTELEAIIAEISTQPIKTVKIKWLDRIRWALFSYEGESLESFVGRKND